MVENKVNRFFILLLLIITINVAAETARSDAYHIGLDFVEEPVTIFACDLVPYPILGSTTHFVTDGGVDGLTANEVFRKIVLAVEEPYRTLNVGAEGTTVGVVFHIGRVPQDVVGKRANVVFGRKVPMFDGEVPDGEYELCIPQFGHGIGNGFSNAVQDENIAAV